MLINGEEIERRLKSTTESDPRKKLIISPILDWGGQFSKGAASIDVRLGSWFLTPSKSKLSELNPLDERYKDKTLQMIDETYVSIGDFFVLHPSQFVLGITLEWIKLPYDLGAYVLGRSSWGREGLIIATATGVQPGFSGVLILELTNVGEIPIKLWPGATIAQLFFHKVGERISDRRDDSIFFGQTKPTRGVPIDRIDRRIIRKFSPETKPPERP